jgi:hypothetical protein
MGVWYRNAIEAVQAMQRHYSTVGGQEIRDGIAKVISLAKFQEAMMITPDAAKKEAGQSESGVHSGVHAPEMKKAS